MREPLASEEPVGIVWIAISPVHSVATSGFASRFAIVGPEGVLR
jgi:hypothetical protein